MDAQRLETVGPFVDLTPAERRMLAGVLDEKRVAEGENVVTEGEYGYEFMVIEDGTVDVFFRGEKVDEMGPGDFFGELAVLSAGGQRNATVVATSPVTLLTLTSHYMRAVREHMPRVGEKIDAAAAQRGH